MTAQHPFADDSHPAQPEVLLVDDDEVNLLLTALALRERGFKMTEVGSGEQALQMLRDWTPDIVVLDAMMPGLDGFDTCRRAAPPARVRERARADADRAGRRRVDHACLRGRRDRLLRQVHAVEPAGRPAALPAARLAHADRARAQQEQAGARAGPGAHGQLRLAAPRSADPTGLLLSPEALRVFGLGPAGAGSVCARCCAWCRTTTGAAFLRMLHEALRHALGAGHRRARSRCSTAASASSTSRPSPSSTSMGTASATPASCRT